MSAINQSPPTISNSESQIKLLKAELSESIHPTLYASLSEYIKKLVDEEMARIKPSFDINACNKFNQIDSKLKKAERNRLMIEYLKLVHPKIFIDHLKKEMQIDSIQSSYHSFCKRIILMNNFEFILSRYRVDDSIFKSYSHYIFSETKPFFDKLNQHHKVIEAHIERLKAIQAKNESNVAYKIGAGLVGSVLAGPVGGILSRKAVNAFTNDDDDQVIASLKRVNDSWNEVIKTWQYVNIGMRVQIETLLYLLLGGYFKKISKDFNDYGFEVVNFNKDLAIQIEIKKKEQKRIHNWMLENEHLLGLAINKKDFKFAHQLSSNLIHYLLQNEQVGSLKPNNLKYNQEITLLNLSYLYRYGIIMNQIETVYWKMGSTNEAFHLYAELVSKLPYYNYKFNNIGEVSVQPLEIAIQRMILLSEKNQKFVQICQNTFSRYLENNQRKKGISEHFMKTYLVYTGYRNNSYFNILFRYSTLYQYYRQFLKQEKQPEDKFILYLFDNQIQKEKIFAVLTILKEKYIQLTYKVKFLQPSYLIPVVIILFLIYIW